MAYENMVSKLVGWLPRLAKSEAYNLVNEAWMDVRNDRLWSFQLGEDGINTPNQITAGTFTTTLGSNLVTANSVASAAIFGLSNPVLTRRQFRVQGYSIYNILSADFSAPAAVVLTLDRVYSDPTGTGLPYQIYQAYYPAPVPDFKKYIDWRDMVNGYWMDVHTTRAEANKGDPQRLYYDFPYYVLSYGEDQRAGSATLGWPMHELYPNPLSSISYMRWWLRTGADLVNPGDTLPYPITEKLVSSRSRMLGYQWAEANRDPTIPRGQNSDYKFLYQAAGNEYTTELRLLGMKDRDIVDLFLSRVVRYGDAGRKSPYYNSIVGRAFSGA